MGRNESVQVDTLGKFCAALGRNVDNIMEFVPDETKKEHLMSFIDSYKRLEKLCNEIYGNGVKSYIEEMSNIPMGSRFVTKWDEDLKKLKHYKWVRNQISHDPDCTENNMCEPDDAQWLDNFRSRIMAANDPLALYRKARNPQPAQKHQQTYTPEPSAYTYRQRTSALQKSVGCLTYAIGIMVMVAVVILLLTII